METNLYSKMQEHALERVLHYNAGKLKDLKDDLQREKNIETFKK